MKTAQRFFSFIPVAFFLAVFLAGSVFFFLRKERENLPVYGVVPDFRLVERGGKEVSDSDLRGKVWIADFIFTRCQGQCPLLTSQMAMLEKELAKVFFVSFSVDPDFDSPEVLAKYAGELGAGPDRWFFLTGDKETLNHVTTGLHMNKIDEPIFHSSSFVLVDRIGRVRGYYEANDPVSVDKLRHDAAKLI